MVVWILVILALSTVGSRFCSPGIGLAVGVVRSTKPQRLPTFVGRSAIFQENSTEPLGFTESEETLKVVIQEELMFVPSAPTHCPFCMIPVTCLPQTLVMEHPSTHWLLFMTLPVGQTEQFDLASAPLVQTHWLFCMVEPAGQTLHCPGVAPVVPGTELLPLVAPFAHTHILL